MARGLLQLRPGEGTRLAWVGAVGACYAAATAIGNDVAESVFVTRVGEDQMPLVFLAKGLLDVLAAALYLPLARGRSERAVWLAALGIYTATVMGARAAVTGGSDASAFALFIGHETAWTILTIHWGVFILDVFDASQARRLFPILFTTARVGGILAGLLVQWLAVPLGVLNLLFFCAGFAVLAGLVSLVRRADRHVDASMGMEAPDRASPEADEDDAPTAIGSWREAARSPLVRIIALTTGAMVLVRYGLHMVALGEIGDAAGGDREQVAAFLGTFGAAANAAGIVLGVFVVPRLLARFGVGAVNVVYAVSTVVAYAALALWPSLGAAVGARFVRVQFKDAVKTPLSTLFYGAEPPHLRAPSRAFIFGAAIPAATVITAGALIGGAHLGRDLEVVVWIGGVVSVLFAVGCWIQNHRWRWRMVELMRWKLARVDADPDAERLERARRLLADDLARVGDRRRAVLDDCARALASSSPRLQAVGEEVLSEMIARRRAHRISAELRG